jgi:uncharacterized protein with gpF-like domain
LRDHSDTLSDLAEAYKQINAPTGKLGIATLTGVSTQALRGDNETYAELEDHIRDLTERRNDIAGKMIGMLENAAFNGQEIEEREARKLIDQAHALLYSSY